MEGGWSFLAPALTIVVPVAIGVAALVVYALDVRKMRRENQQLRDELDRVREHPNDPDRTGDMEILLRARSGRRGLRLPSWRFLVTGALVLLGVAWSLAYQRSLVTELTSQSEVIEEARDLMSTAERQMNRLMDQNRVLNGQLLVKLPQEEPSQRAASPPPKPQSARSRARPGRSVPTAAPRATPPPPEATTNSAGLASQTVASDQSAVPSPVMAAELPRPQTPASAQAPVPSAGRPTIRDPGTQMLPLGTDISRSTHP